jgi:hypothetical protein
MEAALFANAHYLNENATTLLLTVSNYTCDRSLPVNGDAVMR